MKNSDYLPQRLVFLNNFSYILSTINFLNKKRMKKTILSLLLSLVVGVTSFAQVTSSTISGFVKNGNNEPLVGATIEALHQPTGTKYKTSTNKMGFYVLPNIRVGGPYVVTTSYVGYKTNQEKDINTQLGVTSDVNFLLIEGTTNLKEVVVVGSKSGVFSKDRTGASQQFGRRELSSIPITGARTINSITKYNNFGDGSSFGAQDSRLNNFTIDGSQFNNGFGLGSSAQAGGRTGSTAISLDAIEQLQVNVAPFDIKQSGFVGAGINAVTRSGTNKIEGSYYQTQRDNSSRYVGDNAYGVPVKAATFDEKVRGFRLGAPIIKNKLFIFGNYEELTKTEPATTWTAAGSPNAGAQPTRVAYADMMRLQKFLKDTLNYETGPFENYSNTNSSKKFLVRMDWNINDKHKLTARYVHHNSDAQINISNSSSAGAGNRTTQYNSMSFQNSGYVIMDNTRSAVLELNSKFNNTLHNNLIVGYDKQIEDRAYMSSMFPTIDIADGTSARVNYISVGFDPFTPSNKLDYNTFHVTDNLTKYLDKHTLTFGVNYEKYQSNNLFYPASNGVYIFNSLTDFYTAAKQSVLANGAPSTLAPYRFQYRYSALPGGVEPMQVLKTDRLDLYGQDEWQTTDNLKLTFGLRTAFIHIDPTSLENKAVTAMTFANGEKLNTSVMPENQLLWEPRFAFNWDVKGDRKTQVRGGSGVFTGRPPYVFISNQVGNNGVLTGYIDVSGAAASAYGFTTNPAKYFTPSTPTLPSTFDLAFTDPNYKFPQVWKNNIAVDQKLPFGLIGSLEYINTQTINAVDYYNANLKSPVGTFVGPDNRPKFGGTDATVRVNNNVSNAIVLTNKNGAWYDAVSVKLEKPYSKGFFGSLAYTKSRSEDYMSAGSIASGSWTGARSVLGNNNISLSNSDFLVPERMVGLVGYRIEYGKKKGGATSFTLGYVGQRAGGFNYTIAGDMNGDRISGNDLIFVPTDVTTMRFAPLTVGTTVYTEAQQQAAYDAFIKQDDYLSSRRGQYVERNGEFLPMLHRFDLSIVQDFHVFVKGEKNTLQFRFDILNFGNMLNNEWGVSQRATAPTLLTYSSVNASGEPVYKFATQTLLDGSKILARDTYSRNASVYDVWSAQFGVRYIFGR